MYILSPSFQKYETPESESHCNFKASSSQCVNGINQLQVVPFVSNTLILWRVGWQVALTNGSGQEGSYTYNFLSSAELLFSLSLQNKYEQFHNSCKKFSGWTSLFFFFFLSLSKFDPYNYISVPVFLSPAVESIRCWRKVLKLPQWTIME